MGGVRIGPFCTARFAPGAGKPLSLAGWTTIVWFSVDSPAQADAPLNYMVAHGIRAHSIALLAWFMMIVAVIVILVVTGLLLAGIWRRRATSAELPGVTMVSRPQGGASWIYIGVGVSTGVLFATMIWTVITLADTSNPPPGAPAVRLQVTGHQWWWEVRYLDDNPSREFSTANEIRIPVGKIVEVDLRAGDVIHSFWVPALAGKTDLIPGQENKTWIEADHAGIYRGQCGEYCGEQHAHMAFDVVASPPDQFDAWRSQQLRGASEISDEHVKTGENLFFAKCGICHTVRGTRAGGVLGPDLTHVMSRMTIGAATLPNTPAQLAAWIADPQHIKPGNAMPTLSLSAPEMTSIRQYVETLR
jgi:cytochrome c oxidase subunit 2